MAAAKEFYLKAIVTAQDRLSPALKNIVKQAETVRASFGKFNRMSEAALFGFMDRLPAASKQFTLLRGEMAKVGSRFFALGKEVAVAGAGFVGIGGGIMRLISDATAAGDALQKMSIRTGMSAEAIQQWQFVADRSGIPVETMNKSIEKMGVNMGALRAGTGPLVSAVEKFAPALTRQLKGVKSNEEALDLMIRAMRKIPDAARRSYLASQLFGEEGRSLATLANESEESLEALKARARELGLISNEQADQSADFVDKMTDLKKGWGDLRNTFALRLLPSLTPFIAKLTDFLVKNREQVNKVIDSIVKPLSEWLDGLDPGEIVQGMMSLIETFKSAIGFFGGLKNAAIAYIVISNIGLIPAIFKAALAFKGLLVAMGPIGIGIAALVAAGWFLYSNWEEISTGFIGAWKQVADFLSGIWESIKAIFKSGVEWIENLMDTFNPFSAFEGGDGTMLAGAGGASLPARQATAQASQMALANRPAEVKTNIVIEAPEGSRIKEVESKAAGAKSETKVGHRGEGSLS